MATVYTHAGKAIVSKRLVGATPTQPEPKFIGWGTGAGAAAVTDTTLFTEARSAATSGGNVVRVTATTSTVTTLQTNDTFQAVGTLTAEAARTITNAGVFDTDGAVATPGPPAGGNLMVKGDHAGVPMIANDAIEYTFTLQQT